MISNFERQFSFLEYGCTLVDERLMGMKEAMESFDKEKKMSESGRGLNFKRGRCSVTFMEKRPRQVLCIWAGGGGSITGKAETSVFFLQLEQGSRLICLGGICRRREEEEG